MGRWSKNGAWPPSPTRRCPRQGLPATRSCSGYHHEAGRPGLAGWSRVQPRLLGRRRRARAALRRAGALQRRERPQRPGLPEHRRHAARHRLQHRLAARRGRPGRRRRRRGVPHLGRHREPAAGRQDGPRRRAASAASPDPASWRPRARTPRSPRRPTTSTSIWCACRSDADFRVRRRRAGRGLHRRHHHGRRIGADLSPGRDRPHRRHRRAGAGPGHPVPRRRLHGRLPPPVPGRTGAAGRALRLPRSPA